MGDHVLGGRAAWNVFAAFKDWPYDQQLWVDRWVVRPGGMFGERRETGEHVRAEPCGPTQDPWTPQERSWSGLTWLLKGHLAAVYRRDGGSRDKVRG